MKNYNELQKAVESFAPLDEIAIKRLETYYKDLVEWNEKINLTAITDLEGVLTKHFYDSLLFLKYVDLPKNASLIDVGTGAGFPGVVLKIARPDIKLTLLDGLNKRLLFLESLLKNLGLEAETVHLRAEEGGKNEKYREKFDFATARAVARLNLLSEYCLPFVKRGGSFVALKGPTAEEEMAEARNAIQLCGGKKSEIFSEKLPDGSDRAITVIKKISQTPTKFPRPHAKIAKKPL